MFEVDSHDRRADAAVLPTLATGASPAIVMVLALSLMACDPLAPSAYQGDPLVTIRGQATVVPHPLTVPQNGGPPTVPQPPLPRAEMSLLWLQPGDGGGVVSEKFTVSASFPAEFRLEIRHPAPPAAAIEFEGHRMQMAAIAAFEAGFFQTGQAVAFDDMPPASAPPNQEPFLFRMMGMATDVVVHFERDVPADHPFSVLLGGITSAGFHLMTLGPVTPEEKQKRLLACRQLNFTDCGNDGTPPDQDLFEAGGGFERHRVRLDVFPPLTAFRLGGTLP